MKRSTLTASTTLLGGLAALTIAGCSSTQNGTGSAAPALHPAPTNPASSAAVAAVATPADAGQSDDPAVAGATGAAADPSTTSTTAPAPIVVTSTTNPPPNVVTSTVPSTPAIISASVTCVVSSYEDLPGLPHVPQYTPLVSWKVAHATGLALSVDDTTPGSYGHYGPSGSTSLGSGCYSGGSPTTIVFYTEGGTGPRASRTITLVGTHNTVTPPPYAGG